MKAVHASTLAGKTMLTIEHDAEMLIKLLTEKRLRLVVAESCTGGLVGSLLSAVPGASEVFWGAFITYTLDAKQTMLGIDSALLERYGAVSKECASAMAASAREHAEADLALSVTGLAGPDGDGSLNQVGTVWIGSACRGAPPEARLHHFTGSRTEVRTKAAAEAIRAGIELAGVRVDAARR
jgi:PncC family amidohydrolase